VLSWLIFYPFVKCLGVFLPINSTVKFYESPTVGHWVVVNVWFVHGCGLLVNQFVNNSYKFFCGIIIDFTLLMLREYECPKIIQLL